MFLSMNDIENARYVNELRKKTRNKFFMNVSYILALIPCVLPVFWIVNYFYFNHSNKDNKCITHG